MTAPSNTVCRLLGRPRVPRRRKTGPTCHKLTKHGLIRRSVVFAKQLRETWCFLQRFCILVFFANLALKVVVLCNLLHHGPCTTYSCFLFLHRLVDQHLPMYPSHIPPSREELVSDFEISVRLKLMSKKRSLK